MQKNSLNAGFLFLLPFAIRVYSLIDWPFQTVCMFENRHVHEQKPLCR